MNFLHGRPAYPRDRDLVRVVRASASRLVGKLDDLEPESLDLSLETRRILGGGHESLQATVERCAHVFAWSLPRNDKPFSDLTLIAFGDGLGFFSLLAKECNVGTVIYHDTDDALRCDAKTIASAIGNTADYYVFGDVEELEFVVQRYSISCDVFVSSEAVDHAEKLIPLFDTVSERANGAMSLGLGVETGTSSSPGYGRHEKVLARFRDDLAQVGFEMNLLRGYPRRFLQGTTGRIGESAGRAADLVLGFSTQPNVTDSASLVLCGSRSSRSYAAPSKAAASPSAGRTPKPDEVFLSQSNSLYRP